MRKKRFLAGVLAIAMLVTSFEIPIFADGTVTGTITYDVSYGWFNSTDYNGCVCFQIWGGTVTVEDAYVTLTDGTIVDAVLYGGNYYSVKIIDNEGNCAVGDDYTQVASVTYVVTYDADEYYDEECWIGGGIAIMAPSTDWWQYVAEWGKTSEEETITINGITAEDDDTDDTVGIPEDAVEYNGHYYYLYEDGYTWEEAEAYCKELGGHLITVTTQEEQDLLEDMLSSATKNSYWMGGYKDEDGTWCWVTGEEFSYKNWAYGEPNNYTSSVENSLMVYRNDNPRATGDGLGTWNDINSDGTSNDEEFFGLENFGFVCEWEPDEVNSYEEMAGSATEISSDSFYITRDIDIVGVDYASTTILTGDFYFYPANEDDDLKAEVEAIEWTSSDESVATVEYDSCSISNGKATGYLTITSKKPGLVTITGTASDGRVAAKQISIEPELQVGNYSQASAGSVIKCTVELEEADAEYLKWFMSNLDYSVTGTKMSFNESYEVADDGLSAVYSLEVTSVSLDYGLSGTSTVKFISYGGQKTSSGTMSLSNGTLNNEFPPSTDLDHAISGWRTAYDAYIDALKEAIQTYLTGTTEDTREDSIAKEKKKMMKWDKDSNHDYKYLTTGGTTDDDMIDAEYEALATYLYDNVLKAATSLDLSTISAKDSSAPKLVSKIIGLVSGTSATYIYDDITVRISGFSFFNVGYASITCTKTGCPSDIAVFCSDQESINKVVNGYLEQLEGLEISAIETAAYECINSSVKVLLNKSLTDLTTDYLKSKLSDYTSEIMSTGVGDLLTDLNNCYNYYNYIKKLQGVLDSDETPENIYETISAIEFKDSSIESNVVKKALKVLNKAATKVNRALWASIYGDESLTEQIKAIFTCPVDVAVYSSDGTQIGYVSDDDIWYDEDLIYIEEDGGAKIVHSYTDDTLSFTLTATGYGTLGCCIEEYDTETGRAIGRSNTYDVPLSTGLVLEVASTIDDTDDIASSYTVTVDDEVIMADEYISGTDDAVIYVGSDITGNGTIYGIGQYVPGDAVVLYALPDEGYAFVGWYKDDTIVCTDKTYEFTAREDTTISAVFVESIDDISEATYTLGDVNQDDVIDYLDAMTVLRYDAELVTLTDDQLLAGDVNEDDSVDSLDAILILRYDAGLIENF